MLPPSKSETPHMNKIKQLISQNKVMVFDKMDNSQLQPGSFVHVMAESCTQGTLMGKIVNHS